MILPAIKLQQQHAVVHHAGCLRSTALRAVQCQAGACRWLVQEIEEPALLACLFVTPRHHPSYCARCWLHFAVAAFQQRMHTYTMQQPCSCISSRTSTRPGVLSQKQRSAPYLCDQRLPALHMLPYQQRLQVECTQRQHTQPQLLHMITTAGVLARTWHSTQR